MAITRYLKIGEESEFGVEASEYPETLDPESASIDPAGDDKLIYEGIGGLDRRAGLGTYSTAGEIAIPLDDKATGWFWKWALGGYEVTGDEESNSYTHVFSPQQGGLMPSFSAKIGKDIFEHIFVGNVVESISLEVESEWALMTVSTLGAKDKKGPLATDLDYTEGMLFTAPMASLTKNGVDKSAAINSLSLNIETGADIESSQGFGSRFPTKAFRGSLLAELEVELGFDSTEELFAFWGGNDGPSNTNIEEFKYTLSFGNNVDIIFPRLVYTTSGQPVEGRDGIVQSLTARALYDDVLKQGPVIVSITNDRPKY
jgi:Phage tail tube protein